MLTWMPYWRPSSTARSICFSGSSRTSDQSSRLPQFQYAQRQAGEVEAPLRHRGEVGLLEGGAVVGVSRPAEAALEVEASPAGNPARGGLVVRGQRRARGHPGGDAEDGQVLDELPSLHRASLHRAASAGAAGPQTTPRGPGGATSRRSSPEVRAALYSRRHSLGRRRLVPRFILSPTLAAAALAAAAVAGPQASPPPPTAEARQKLAAELDAYLWKHVLAPRFPRCVDKEHGGFHIELRARLVARSRTARGSSSTRRGSSGRRRPSPGSARRRATSTCPTSATACATSPT